MSTIFLGINKPAFAVGGRNSDLLCVSVTASWPEWLLTHDKRSLVTLTSLNVQEIKRSAEVIRSVNLQAQKAQDRHAYLYITWGTGERFVFDIRRHKFVHYLKAHDLRQHVSGIWNEKFLRSVWSHYKWNSLRQCLRWLLVPDTFTMLCIVLVVAFLLRFSKQTVCSILKFGRWAQGSRMHRLTRFTSMQLMSRLVKCSRLSKVNFP